MSIIAENVADLIKRATSLYEKGDWNDALNLLNKITESASQKKGDPLNERIKLTFQQRWKITNLKAWIYWKRGEKTAARNLWLAVADSRGKNKAEKEIINSANTGLGIYWAEQGNREQAIRHSQLAVFCPPEKAVIRDTINLNGCAVAMAKIGEFKRAKVLFKKASGLNKTLMNSEDPEVEKKATHQLSKNCYNLAALIYIPQREWKNALVELHKAILGYKEVSAETDEAAAHHRTAEVFENQGRLKEALASETRSMQLWKNKNISDRVKMAEENIARLKKKLAE